MSLELLTREQNLYQFSLPPWTRQSPAGEADTLDTSWNSTHTWIQNWRSWRGTQGMAEQVSQRPFPSDMNQIKNINALPWPSKHENKWLLSPSKSPFISLVKAPESGRWHQVKATHSQRVSSTATVFYLFLKVPLLFQTLFHNVHSTKFPKVMLWKEREQPFQPILNNDSPSKSLALHITASTGKVRQHYTGKKIISYGRTKRKQKEFLESTQVMDRPDVET